MSIHTFIEKQTGDGAQALSRLEAEALAYLTGKAGVVVTTEELVREVWKQAEIGEAANQVRCCIKRLRRKLRESSENTYQILTVRGRGYRLVVDESLKNSDP